LAYILTTVLGFVIIFQPGVLLPAVAPFRPLFLTALLALAAWTLTPKNPTPLKPKPYLSYLIIGFVAAQSLSVLQYFWGQLLIQTTVKWGNLALVYFLVSSQMTTEQRLRRFWIVVLTATCWLAAQATWVYHTQDVGHPQLFHGRLSSYGAYSGANDLALIMVCAWPILFKFTDLRHNLLLKLIPLLFCFLLVYVNLRTISRGGLLGMALVVGLSMMRGRSLGKLGRWGLIVPAALVIIMVGSKILLTRKDTQDFSGRDKSVEHRLDAWWAGYQMFKSSPIYGIGSDRFPEFSKDFGTPFTIQAHNTIVKVVAESGLLGLGCYLGFLFVAFRSLWRSWRRFSRLKPDGPEVLWAEAFAISLIGFFFNTQFSVKAHEWFLYLVVASSISLERMYLQEAVKKAVTVEGAIRLIEESGTKSA